MKKTTLVTDAVSGKDSANKQIVMINTTSKKNNPVTSEAKVIKSGSVIKLYDEVKSAEFEMTARLEEYLRVSTKASNKNKEWLKSARVIENLSHFKSCKNEYEKAQKRGNRLCAEYMELLTKYEAKFKAYRASWDVYIKVSDAALGNYKMPVVNNQNDPEKLGLMIQMKF